MNVQFARVLVAIALMSPLRNYAQQWASILKAGQAIDWSKTGVGAIPARPAHCATLAPAATTAEINRALATCAPGQAVYLEAGSYTVTGPVHVPSNVTLRGAGADRTILRAAGTGDAVIQLGNGWASYKPVKVVGEAADGATQLLLDHTAGVHPGMFLVVTEQNDPRFVSPAGSQGSPNFCNAGWLPTGEYCRGQIVEVTQVLGDRVTFAPGLYGGYRLSPIAVPFEMDARQAGVEDLQVVAGNTGFGANFAMSACAYCWIKGVESNYAGGDHVEIQWGFRDEVRDSYFSNAYLHRPGRYDSDILLKFKTSATLVENNILERTHQSVLLQWGAAGNVIAYNYTTGEFDSGAVNDVVGGVFLHGAHPQYNLLEGNVMTRLDQDSTWGTSSHTTAFRNWVVGTNHICQPMTGRGPVSCSGTNGHYGYQAARAIQLSYLATANNFVGNVVGSAQMQSLSGEHGLLRQEAAVEYPARRSYDSVAYGWSFGYGSESDDGSGTGCTTGAPPCHAARTSATDFFDGNFTNADHSIHWAGDTAHPLPASFYLPGKPAWWGALPFPATGPEIHGGEAPQGHSYGNPAERCYRAVMGGSDGGEGSPRSFNAAACYGMGGRTTSGSGVPTFVQGPSLRSMQ